MSKELMMDLYFKPRKCTKCGEEARPVTGEFLGFDTIYRVHFYCPHCNNGFEKQWGG